MSFVLGKYANKDGSTDFFAVSEQGYDDLQIEEIKDPEGGERMEMPTAVPSPFARFDLVQTAFKNINKNQQLVADKGKDIKASKFDERMVSHTLDLAEYVFNSQARGGKLDVLTWERNGDSSHLKKLKNGTKEHQDFAEALELYLNQDADAYNFNQMNKIFMFKYSGDIIGSTSPVTLFCPSASNLSKLNIRRMADRSLAFGEDFLPLYKRTFEFQEWFYCLLAVCKTKLSSNVKKNLDCMFDYATLSLKQLNGADADKLRNIFDSKMTEDDFKEKYSPLNDKKGNNSPVDILGVELCIGKKGAIEESLLKSDFLIKPTKNYKETLLPLVLQNGFGKAGWNYLRGLQFQSSIEVPNYVDDKLWTEKRVMPGFSDIEGYYLTISDFLEPYLIQTIYPISDNFYYAGCKSDKENQGYLLPLKKDFFKFFKVEDLIEGGSEKPNLFIEPKDNGNVEVTLKIPVQKGDITFKRIYKRGDQNQQPNQRILDGGVILEAKFGTTIFPFVKTNELANINYRIQLVDTDITSQLKNRDYSLEFFTEEGKNVINSNDKYKHRRFDKKHSSNKYTSTSDYYRVKKEFDIIQFKINNLKADALIIPKWPVYKGGSAQFTFAVDFGTTNTYVAYKTEKESASAFYLNDAIVTLFDEKHSETESKIRSEHGADDIIDLIDREFVPRRIGKRDEQDDNIFIFPQRTAVAYNQEMTEDDWNDEGGLDTLLEGNIPFGYEKTAQKGNEIATDLKWGGNDKINKQISAYLEEIIMLMQAKVLLENGDLKESRLVWFFPNSMTRPQKDFLARNWKRYFSDYFFKGQELPKDKENNLANVASISESLAPFYAERDGNAFQGGAVASIDIGGGTTDVAVFGDVNGKTALKATTSFKFAGNALFGDGYSKQAADRNGFVLRFADYFATKLKDYPKPRDILKELRDPKRAKASDINTFLFSVENAISYWAKGKEMSRAAKADFSYTERLRECDDLKFLILYFYVALVYHISKVLKKIGEPVQYLMFSGTASKMLNILVCENEEDLSEFTRKIFKELGLESKNLEVILVDKPKEVTCNGGLKADFAELRNASKDVRDAEPIIYTCIKGKEFDTTLKYSDYKNGLEDIKSELIKFHEFFFKLNEDRNFNFADFWGIKKEAIKYVQSSFENLLDKWLKDSITRNQPTDEKTHQPIDDVISETPFFIPLKSIILEWSEQIAKKWDK